MYDHRSKPLLPRAEFYRRVARSCALGMSVAAGSLAIGMLGYHHFEKMGWVDSYVNASMILSGMGPVDQLKTTGGKLFASVYALFSGVAFVAFVGVLLSPVFHRFLHKFHLDPEPASQPKKRAAPADKSG